MKGTAKMKLVQELLHMRRTIDELLELLGAQERPLESARNELVKVERTRPARRKKASDPANSSDDDVPEAWKGRYRSDNTRAFLAFWARAIRKAPNPPTHEVHAAARQNHLLNAESSSAYHSLLAKMKKNGLIAVKGSEKRLYFGKGIK
jgi:hypothetical protein